MSKNIVILNGSPRKTGNTSELVRAFAEGAVSTGSEVEVFHLDSLEIHGFVIIRDNDVRSAASLRHQPYPAGPGEAVGSLQQQPFEGAHGAVDPDEDACQLIQRRCVHDRLDSVKVQLMVIDSAGSSLQPGQLGSRQVDVLCEQLLQGQVCQAVLGDQVVQFPDPLGVVLAVVQIQGIRITVRAQ